MCGLVGAVARRDVVPELLQGLYRLEYRGYDSAGMAVLNGRDGIQRLRVAGRIAGLDTQYQEQTDFSGTVGIAHTRWATHGGPSVDNAHPHVDSTNSIALVHNGIIENHAELRKQLLLQGCQFNSETDTESLAHLAGRQLQEQDDPVQAMRATLAQIKGSYALGLIRRGESDCMLAARCGSPLVIGFGRGANYIASDVMALLPITSRFAVLEDGDVALLQAQQVRIFDAEGNAVHRPVFQSETEVAATAKGSYRHYMLKEIHEQPSVVRATLQYALRAGRINAQAFGVAAPEVLERTRAVQIVACGTSYHAGLIGARWIEELAGLPCRVEVASEFRYQRPVATADSLLVAISQSGETADTLAAIRYAAEQQYAGMLAICNVAESALVRACPLHFITRAGIEIGVASTKAFTSQLVAMLLLALLLARRPTEEQQLLRDLTALPAQLEAVLAQDIAGVVAGLSRARSALYLGRGRLWPVAMEGALKLKEISYIHAEAYPAGELKHGPLALVDEAMPVVALVANDVHRERLKANLEEVLARGGQLLLLTQPGSGIKPEPHRVRLLELPACQELLTPLLFTLPLQLLAYETAVLRGADVDQPRNLAKSVTVE